MHFDSKKFKGLYQWIMAWVFSVGLLVYLGTYNSLDDSRVYSQLQKDRPVQLIIEQLNNVGNRDKFPLLMAVGRVVGEERKYEFRVSRGEFESLTVGETTTAFETTDQQTVMTAYAIDNLKPFVSFFGRQLSVYVFAEALLALGLFVVLGFASRTIFRVFVGKV